MAISDKSRLFCILQATHSLARLARRAGLAIVFAKWCSRAGRVNLVLDLVAFAVQAFAYNIRRADSNR